MNEKIIKDIEEMLMENRTLRSISTSNLYNDNSRHNNDVLARAKQVIIKATDNYEKGLDDAWELVRKLYLLPHEGGMEPKDLINIFGPAWSLALLLRNDSVGDVLEKVKAYEKKKEEEAAKPKIGDVVEVRYCDPKIDYYFIAKGVYIKETDTTHNVLTNKGDVYVITKDNVESVTKTGEHVDILGALGK